VVNIALELELVQFEENIFAQASNSLTVKIPEVHITLQFEQIQAISKVFGLFSVYNRQIWALRRSMAEVSASLTEQHRERFATIFEGVLRHLKKGQKHKTAFKALSAEEQKDLEAIVQTQDYALLSQWLREAAKKQECASRVKKNPKEPQDQTLKSLELAMQSEESKISLVRPANAVWLLLLLSVQSSSFEFSSRNLSETKQSFVLTT